MQWTENQLYTATIDESYFNYIERDGVGDKSGGVFKLQATYDFDEGDKFRVIVQNSNAFAAILNDHSLKVDCDQWTHQQHSTFLV